MKEIHVLNYGVGNIRSVQNAVLNCNAKPILTKEYKDLKNASHLIIPGVGAFGDCVNRIKKENLDDVILELFEKKIFILGICVGMQMFMESSTEFGFNKGLNLFNGNVEKIPKTFDNKTHKIPFIGWSKLKKNVNSWESTILEGITSDDYFYFIHSYECKPKATQDCLAFGKYSGMNICAVIHKDNIYGVQFHPEKSAGSGLKIIQNFINTK